MIGRGGTLRRSTHFRALAGLLLLVSLLVLSPTVQARDSLVNRQVRATRNVNLRDPPRAGLFYKSGRVLGTVRTGEKLLVLDERSVRTLFGQYQWIRVRRISPSGSGPLEGWAYKGEAGKGSYFERPR